VSERQIRRARERLGKSERGIGRKAALAAGAAFGATVVFAPAAQADTFTVDTLEDEDDGSCDPGECSLREASEEANTAAGADEIVFASGLTGTITLTDDDGAIYLLDEVAVTGPGANVLTVSGDDDTRVFYVDAGTNGDDYDPVTISGLTVTEGYDSSRGGALYSEDTTLTLADMAFVDNAAGTGGGGAYVDDGTLTITGSVFSGNTAPGGGGALYLQTGEEGADVGVLVQGSTFTDNTSEGGDGGALYLNTPEGDVVFERVNVSGNDAGDNGGGIYIDEIDGGAFRMTGSTVSGNEAENAGGGVYVSDLYDEGATIESSTISGNEVTGDDAGGVYIRSIDGDVLIENTTISGNRAYYSGGGIYFEYLYDDHSTTIRNSTIVDNVAGTEPDSGDEYAGGGVYLYDDSDSTEENGPVTISSTIVANNSADAGSDLGSGEFADGFEVGFSLIETGSAARDPQQASISESPAGSNLFGVDPALGSLASNGGPTQTHLPALGSPVVDKGIANGLATDQRGLARTGDLSLFANATGGDGTDIGAVEIQAADCQGQGALKLDGTGGDDTLTGTDGPDSIAGLAGNDTATGGGANDCVNGDEGKDRVSGGPGKDNVKGGAGKDRVRGNGGKDKVKGNAGKDQLAGGGGKDKLSGAGGKDRLSGGGGKDRLKGGPGKDKLSGGGGKDRFNCGGGKDKVTAQAKDKVSASCEKVVEKG
jgi:CSLREA domain-containing protein